MKIRPRIIPVLLLSDGYLVKPQKFKKPQYIGDPINAVRIFNEKEVDELIVLDIDASTKRSKIRFDQLEEIVSEAFMPIGYGGGITNLQDSSKLLNLGLEKVVLNSSVAQNPEIVTEISSAIGSSSTVVGIDVKKKLFGYEVFTNGGTKATGLDPVSYAKKAQELGAGEVIIQAIDREGTFSGYDLALISAVSSELSIPVVALGGAGKLSDHEDALSAGAAATAAGSMFVLNGPHRAVLITYPKIG